MLLKKYIDFVAKLIGFTQNWRVMTAKDLILNSIPVLNPAMYVSDALLRMEEAKLSFLPVTDGDIYLGTICEKSLHDFVDVQQPIGTDYLSFPFVRDESHIFDALSQITQLSIDMLPVISFDNRYLGAIGRESLLKQLSVVCNTNQQEQQVNHRGKTGSYHRRSSSNGLSDVNSPGCFLQVHFLKIKSGRSS